MKMNKTMFGISKCMSVLAVSLLLFGACKDVENFGPDPYAGGKESLGVGFAEALPSPSQGKAGTAMTFKVYGIEKYKDRVQFLINNMEAELTSITDSTITAILPLNVSTGGTSLVIDGQVYPGPICQVIGKLGVDLTFNAGVGANGPIFTIKQLSNNQIIIGGSFSDYNGFSSARTINSITRITSNGAFVGMNSGEGMEGGSVTTIHERPTGTLLLSGNIPVYDKVTLMSNVLEINASGSMAKKTVSILNLTDDPSKSTLEVPTFNGGTNLGILKSFIYNNKLTAIGGFTNYVDRFYPRSTYDNVLTGFFPMGSVVRMEMDGALDSTFNINRTVKPAIGNKGLEGILNDGFMQADGRLIVVGRFQRYNTNTVSGNILRINLDGSQDATFQIGTGASDAIYTILKSNQSDKLILTGFFTSFNNVTSPNLIMLNADGSVDATFRSLGFSGGVPNYAKQLSNGLILVAGSFTKYNGIVREGLCMLNPDGTLAQEYNNTGKLDGTVYDILEGTNSLGVRTVTLVGQISRFNGKSNIGNILRLTIQH